MSSSLLLQQCPACLVRLTWIVFVMGGRWPYSWGVTSRTCLLQLTSFLCNGRQAFLVRVHVVHPYSSTDTTAVSKNM